MNMKEKRTHRTKKWFFLCEVLLNSFFLFGNIKKKIIFFFFRNGRNGRFSSSLFLFPFSLFCSSVFFFFETPKDLKRYPLLLRVFVIISKEVEKKIADRCYISIQKINRKKKRKRRRKKEEEISLAFVFLCMFGLSHVYACKIYVYKYKTENVISCHLLLHAYTTYIHTLFSLDCCCHVCNVDRHQNNCNNEWEILFTFLLFLLLKEKVA